MTNRTAIDAAIAYLGKHRERFLNELFDFLRIPSISAQKEHADDVRAAATWARDRLIAAGLSAEIVESKGWPAVIAQSKPIPDAPTVTIYGHYDVQPEGDLSLWETGPFEPVVKDGKIVCRGAADDKGQVLCAIVAVEAWLKTAGSLPINVRFCLEGEEEIGSPNLAAVIESNRDRLACDYVVIHDTPQYAEGTPAVTVATKGLVYKEIIVRGPKKDLHSGSFGGTVANPATELAKVLATLIDGDGRVNIPGFYERVKEMAPAEVAEMNALPVDEAALLADLGSPALYGEKGYSTIHRRWARPTLDVNGIFGGYMKEGAATCIPAWAGAKVSMRLVADQAPAEIGRLFEECVRSRFPDTVKVEIKSHASCGPYLADVTSAGMAAARAALAVGFGKEPVMLREGGSLPILPMFKSILGADSLMVGYCVPLCNAHSPNEFLHVRDFEAGMRTSTALFGLLAKQKRL